MGHRDDHEAARHRIAALERELEETRQRAETAEAAAKSARETAEKTAAEAAKKKASVPQRGHKKKHEKPAPEAAPVADPRWPPGAKERYRVLVGGAALVYAPVALLSFSSDDRQMFVAFGAAACAHVVGTYIIGRVCRAPFPFNGSLVLLLAAPIILLGIAMCVTDMLWGGLIPPGLLQWIARGTLGIAILAIGAIMSAAWASDAASSDVGPD